MKQFVICRNCGKRAYPGILKGYYCDSDRCEFYTEWFEDNLVKETKRE